jgi:hypothetical protein
VLPPVVAAPAADGEHNKEGGGNNEVRVAIPKLLELLAPYFLIDFPENIRHFKALRPGLKAVSAQSFPNARGR